MHNISLLVGIKNNLSYSKFFYESTRRLYPLSEIVFVSYGSTDGTHEWLDSLNDGCVKYYYEASSKTLADTYNKCTQLATKDYVAYLHNDIVITDKFIENIEKHVSPQTVVGYTTIEPPLFDDHVRPGKINHDFGSDLKSLRLPELYEFSKAQQKIKAGQTEDGVFFFLCTHRETLLKIGGLDNLFNPMFCEDDDLILRMKLLGLKTFTSQDAICYHFISKTSRFSDEYKNKTQAIELQSQRNFFRKWFFRNDSSAKCSYDIGIVVKNATDHILQIIEPCCAIVYTDHDPTIYISSEQFKTKISLKEKFRPFDAQKSSGILVFLDGKKFNDSDENIVRSLSEIVKNPPKPTFLQKLLNRKKHYKISNIEIKIMNLTSFEKDRIYLKGQG